MTLSDCWVAHINTDVLLLVDLKSMHSIPTFNDIFSWVCMDIYRHLVFIPER